MSTFCAQCGATEFEDCKPTCRTLPQPPKVVPPPHYRVIEFDTRRRKGKR